MARKRREQLDQEREAAMLRLRVAELEVRLKNLEASLKPPKLVEAPRPKVQSKTRRPRCPGCTLEVPAGRRTVACVWCGFRFDAVKPRR